MSVTVEAGKRYEATDGTIMGPMIARDGDMIDRKAAFFCQRTGWAYRVDGRINHRPMAHLDLLAEVPAAPAQPEGWQRELLRNYIAAKTSHWLSAEQCDALLRALVAPPAPPAPVEREVELYGYSPTGPWHHLRFADHTHRLTLRWTEPPGAPRGEVTGEWERIGGEHG